MLQGYCSTSSEQSVPSALLRSAPLLRAFTLIWLCAHCSLLTSSRTTSCVGCGAATWQVVVEGGLSVEQVETLLTAQGF